jgi:WS/DGAT/MGAT family acyltransferase
MPPHQRLAPLDEAFLAVESSSAHMHVGWAAIFRPPANEPRPTFERLRDHIAARLPRAPRYRQMLRPVPLGLGAPVWIDDPDFDVRRHVRLATGRDLGELIDERLSKPLPRNRPLWEISIAPRLADGRLAIVGKAHHCMVDGVAAVELASLLLDPDSGAPDPPPERWSPAPVPGDLSVLARGTFEFGRHQLGLLRVPSRLLRAPGRALSGLQRATGALADATRPAPAGTPLNREISPERHLGRLMRPMADLIAIKRAFGVTVNDVVLAACSTATRDLFRAHHETPIRLKTMVPVNVRTGDATDLGNRISFMFVDLPCDEPDPIRRLRDIHASTRRRKEEEQPRGGSDLMDWLGFVPSPLRRLASGLVASPRAFNLVVSNIPGPPDPLYMRGCELVEAYPVVPIPDEHTVSIGLTTVGDRAFFGVYGDRRTEPDLTRLGAGLDRAIDELLDLARDPVERVPVPVGG